METDTTLLRPQVHNLIVMDEYNWSFQGISVIFPNTLATWLLFLPGMR